MFAALCDGMDKADLIWFFKMLSWDSEIHL